MMKNKKEMIEWIKEDFRNNKHHSDEVSIKCGCIIISYIIISLIIQTAIDFKLISHQIESFFELV